MLNAVPSEMKERLAGTAIRSITQPLLVLSLGFSLPALVVARFLSGVALAFDLGLAIFFPLLYGVTHVYFMFADPDRLQSEEWRLRDRSLTLLETSKGVIHNTALLEVTVAPTTPALNKAENDIEDAEESGGVAPNK